MTERSEKKKPTNLLKKKELLNAIAKSETGKILVRGSKARFEKELKTDTTRRKALCGSIEVRMS
jgi:hypothetical protein